MVDIEVGDVVRIEVLENDLQNFRSLLHPDFRLSIPPSDLEHILEYSRMSSEL